MCEGPSKWILGSSFYSGLRNALFTDDFLDLVICRSRCWLFFNEILPYFFFKKAVCIRSFKIAWEHHSLGLALLEVYFSRWSRLFVATGIKCLVDIQSVFDHNVEVIMWSLFALAYKLFWRSSFSNSRWNVYSIIRAIICLNYKISNLVLISYQVGYLQNLIILHHWLGLSLFWAFYQLVSTI